VTESGQHLRNYDFHQYASSSARHLSYEAVYRVLAETAQPDDRTFVAEVLAFWQVKDLAELRERGMSGFIADRFERNRVFGEMAPLVTAAALSGVPLACRVCDVAADALSIGIRLLGNCFESQSVKVALIGSAVQSAYMQRGIASALATSGHRHYEIVEAAFSSEVGAVLMALARHGIALEEPVITALRASQPLSGN
jgi:glucosamine kinase